MSAPLWPERMTRPGVGGVVVVAPHSFIAPTRANTSPIRVSASKPLVFSEPSRLKSDLPLPDGNTPTIGRPAAAICCGSLWNATSSASLPPSVP